MLRILMGVVLAGAAAGAAAQTPDAHSVLLEAVEAMLDVRSASYDGKLVVSSGQTKRTVTGKVQIEKNSYSDSIGANVAVRGKISGGVGQKTERFEAAYDGQTVRRLLVGSNVLLQADLGYGGEELLRGQFGALILRNLLVVEPYTEELSAASLVYGGQHTVMGTLCDVIVLSFPKAQVKWYFGRKDRIPRKRERRFLSAQGNQVTSVLTLRNVLVNRDIEASAFTIEAPQGVRVETVGKKPPPTINVGDLVPDWTLTDGDGRPTTLSDYRGKVVVLDFWATWCPHCRKAMPAMQRLRDTYGSRGVEVFGVNCRDRGDVDAAAFVAQRGFTYPVLVDGNKIAPQYRVRGIPAFFVIDREGRLVHSQSGFSAEGEARLAQVIEQYLAKEGT